MSKSLRIGPGIEFPIDVVTQKLAWLGTTGSGKTYAATALAEQMWHAQAQFVALDTMGIWWGLRLDRDGESEGLPITIFGGRKGDLPLRAQDGHLLAEVIVGHGISAILDLSALESDAEKARFASDFADRLYRLKIERPSAIHVFLEEAHEFIPQNVQPGEARMLHHFNRLWKQGRNFGIGGSIISQRPQDVNKKASELSACVFAFNISGTNALKAVQDWMKIPEVAELPTLPMGKEAGKCLIWSPSWLQRTGFERIDPKQTFHASFDPFAPIQIESEDRTLASIDVAALKERFVEVEAEESANDPKLLQKRVKELEHELAQRPGLDIDQAGAAAARLNELSQQVRDAAADFDGVVRTLSGLERALANLAWEIQYRKVKAPDQAPAGAGGDQKPQASSSVAVDAKSETRRPRPNPEQTISHSCLPVLQQTLVDAIALLASMGSKSPTLQHVGAVAGKWHNAGPVRAAFRALTESGHIESDGDRCRLTMLGQGAAEAQPRRTLADIHLLWLGRQTTIGRNILEVLLKHYPTPIGFQDLGQAIGKNINAGPIRGAMRDLAGKGLAVISGSTIAATDLLFPEGIR